MSYRANGKLLLTAEYFVLDGAIALALPVNKGQSLHLLGNPDGIDYLHWQSFNVDGSLWFEGKFSLPYGSYLEGTHPKVGEKLSSIFAHIRAVKPNFLANAKGLKVQTQLDFVREWGLGTSSTLIATMANWAGIDPFKLQFAAFGGSGYDIACANVQHPILYQKVPEIRVEKADFTPSFKEQLYFVYLGKKQNSRTGIAHYRKLVKSAPQLIDEVTALTKACLDAKHLQDFERIMVAHEELIAKNLQMERAKTRYFSDFWGEVKSLGAWGGDFILVTSDRSSAETRQYFHERGFEQFFTYSDFTIFDGMRV